MSLDATLVILTNDEQGRTMESLYVDQIIGGVTKVAINVGVVLEKSSKKKTRKRIIIWKMRVAT